MEVRTGSNLIPVAASQDWAKLLSISGRNRVIGMLEKSWLSVVLQGQPCSGLRMDKKMP
jgi:hypothetical protein